MGSIIGSLVGSFADNNDERAARDAMSEATGAFRDIKVPTIEEQKIALQLLESQGKLTPELEQEILLNPSAMEGIVADPEGKQAQLSALKSLKEIGATGLNATDRQALNQIRSEVSQQDKARTDAILQNAAQRGMGGSGSELAAKLASAQAATELAARQGDNLAAQAQQRSLQAIAQSGTLGGDLRSQQFNEEAKVATAKDAINQFNQQNRASVQQRNVGSKNTAQAANLAEQQRIADQNINFKNQQEMHNKALAQQQFQNSLDRAKGLSGQLRQNQAQYLQDASNTRNMYSQVGSGIEKAGAAIFTGGASSMIPSIPMAGSSNLNTSGFAFKGGIVPGKAKVPGDSIKNDTVKMNVSPEEIIVPRSKTNDPEKAKKFVEKVIKSKKEPLKVSLNEIINHLKKLESK